MVFHRVLAHPKRGGDVLIGLSFHESTDDLQFTFCKSELVISGSCSRRTASTIKHPCERRIGPIRVRLGTKNFNQFRGHLTAHPEFSGNDGTDAAAHEIGSGLSADDSTCASEQSINDLSVIHLSTNEQNFGILADDGVDDARQ